MVMLAGGRAGAPCETQAEDDFAVTAEDVAAAITPRTRAILSCSNRRTRPARSTTRDAARRSPSSPSSKTCSSSPTTSTASCLRRRASTSSRPRSAPRSRKRTILVDGVSKTYAMTGWRIGYTAAPAAADQGDGQDPGPVDVEPAAVAQAAALAALEGPTDGSRRCAGGSTSAARCMVQLLRAIPGVKCREPKGAFYAFPDVSAFVGKKTPEGTTIDDDVQLCDWLVEAARSRSCPGSAFGAPGFVRLSYASSMENIEEGVGRHGRGAAQADVAAASDVQARTRRPATRRPRAGRRRGRAASPAAGWSSLLMRTANSSLGPPTRVELARARRRALGQRLQLGAHGGEGRVGVGRRQAVVDPEQQLVGREADLARRARGPSPAARRVQRAPRQVGQALAGRHAGALAVVQQPAAAPRPRP